MNSVLLRYKEKAIEKKIPLTTNESIRWFQRVIRKTTAKHSSLLNDPAVSVATQLKIGSMYTYVYDPKHKLTLPYYDVFPVIILVDYAENGFYGLNLHYIQPSLRTKLFSALRENLTTKKYGPKTRLRLTYNMLSASSRYKEFAPSFKRYLYDHVASKVVEINPSEWEIAIHLPVEGFMKETAKTVWRKSKGKI